MSGIGTVLLVYGLFTLFMVYMLVFIFTFREIKLKVSAKLKLKRGFGIIEIIKKNGMLNQVLADFSKDTFLHKGCGYSIKSALAKRTNYLKYIWGNVPVIGFCEGDPEPLAIAKDVTATFDLEYYNKTVELAYITGATEKYGKTLDQLKKYTMITLACSGITAMAVLYVFPHLPAVIETLQAIKPYMANLAPKLIAWLQ